LISSSDRRVLDELVPDSTHSARDRQSNFYRPAGDSSRAQLSNLLFLPFRFPLSGIFIESTHGKTRKRLANSQPARLAFQLEARRQRTTILSNVPRKTERSTTRFAKLQTRKSFDSGDRRLSAAVSAIPFVSRRTFQETLSTQWQKN
jgi:hypothetical protein